MSNVNTNQSLDCTQNEQDLNKTKQTQEEAEKALFPLDELQKLDEMLARPRWIVPVMPKSELENLLDAAINLCRLRLDTQSEPCQRFFRDGLTISFVRIFTDDAVTTWKYDIYKHIYNNTLKAIELCSLKLLEDWFPLLDLLALIFNPQCKYHKINSIRSPELNVKVNFTRNILPQPEDSKSSQKRFLKKPKRVITFSGQNESPKADQDDFIDEANQRDLNSEKISNSQQEKLIQSMIKDDFGDDSESKLDEKSEEEEDGDVNADADVEDEDQIEAEDGDDEEIDLNELEKDLENDTPQSPENEELDEIIDQIKAKNDNSSVYSPYDSDIDDDKTNVDIDSPNSMGIRRNKNNLVDFDEDNESLQLRKQKEISDYIKNSNSVSLQEPEIDQNSQTRQSKSKKDAKKYSTIGDTANTVTTITTYAKSFAKSPCGWLVDFLNYFGELNGFDLLLERFTNNTKLSIQVIAALLKPFGLCYEFLTPYTIRKYFLPIIDIVPKFFEKLSDEDIAKECKSENKNDSISSVIKWLKLLATRVKDQQDLCRNLEILRLKTILRILKFASFNGKMNALNEVNKVISNITYNIQMGTSSVSSSSCSSRLEGHEEEWLTSERMATWIQENDVLDIVLRDCMHQPQYVEKLEKILRFLIKEKALTLKDLDKIWESQLGKHDAIEKNVHDLLSKLAWDFSPEQLDHLFSCFQKSWTNATRKQREKLLDLIRSLSEDDKEGVMANKVLDLLWNLSHSEDAPTEIIDQAVSAHVKILDYSCSSDKEAQKLKYLEKCIDQLKENKWVIVSLRQIREILQQYSELITGTYPPNKYVSYSVNSSNSSGMFGNSQINLSSQIQNNISYTRPEIITKLQKEYSLVDMITNNLAEYYDSFKKF
ncbi:putative ubiquitin carboxyl-terminal hydrolase FAF, partial [Brachionus plicatilis]